MPASIYRQTIKNAWHITWKNKNLWILGLLAVLIGQFGLADFSGRLLGNIGWAQMRYVLMGWQIDAPTGLGLAWVGLILLTLVFFIIVAAAVAEGALIYGAAYTYKKDATPKFQLIWERGAKYIWRVISVSLFRNILLCALVLTVISVWQKIQPGGVGADLAYTIIVICAYLLAAVISSVSIFALCYIVIGGHTFIEAIKRGWKLFSDHLLVSLELTALLFLLNFVLIFIIFLTTAFIFLPSLIIWLIGGLTNQTTFFIAGLMVGWIIFILSVGVIGAIYNTFTINAWVALFMRMHHEGIGSRLLHHLKKLFNS